MGPCGHSRHSTSRDSGRAVISGQDGLRVSRTQRFSNERCTSLHDRWILMMIEGIFVNYRGHFII